MNPRQALAAGIALACILLLAAVRSSRSKPRASRRAPPAVALVPPSCGPCLASRPELAPAEVAAPQDGSVDDGAAESPPTEEWDCPGDGDGDGLLDVYELAVGLDPRSADSDGDGLPDEDEEASPGVTHFEAQGQGAPSAGCPDE